MPAVANVPALARTLSRVTGIGEFLLRTDTAKYRSLWYNPLATTTKSLLAGLLLQQQSGYPLEYLRDSEHPF